MTRLEEVPVPKATAGRCCNNIARSPVVSTTCTVGPEGTTGDDVWLPEHEKLQQKTIERTEHVMNRGEQAESMINSTLNSKQSRVPKRRQRFLLVGRCP
jgi:hypothetical protein